MFWVKGSRMLWDVSMLLRMACLLKLMNYFQDFPFSMSEIVDHCSLKPEKVKEWIRDGGVGVAAAWTTKTAALVQALALATSFCPGKTLEGNDRRKVVTKLWPSPNSIPCLVYNLAQPSPQSRPPPSFSQANSSESFEIHCSSVSTSFSQRICQGTLLLLQILLTSFSSSLCWKTMEESWPKDVLGVGRNLFWVCSSHCCCQNHC